MGPIQTRTFWRIVSATYPNSDVDAVSAEVNAFLATLDPNNVLDIRYNTSQAEKYGTAMMYAVMIIYLS